MRALIARFRRARMKAAATLVHRATKDGDREAAEVWAPRLERWSSIAAKHEKPGKQLSAGRNPVGVVR
jgi:hypothetical protein